MALICKTTLVVAVVLASTICAQAQSQDESKMLLFNTRPLDESSSQFDRREVSKYSVYPVTKPNKTKEGQRSTTVTAPIDLGDRWKEWYRDSTRATAVQAPSRVSKPERTPNPDSLFSIGRYDVFPETEKMIKSPRLFSSSTDCLDDSCPDDSIGPRFRTKASHIGPKSISSMRKPHMGLSISTPLATP